MINLEIITFIFDYVFKFLNLQITVPLNFDGTEKLSFPLYVVFITLFVIEMIKVLWAGMMFSNTDIS